MTEVKIPDDQWSDDKEAVITSWSYEDGAEVKEGDTVAEIMVEKAQIEISAPASGVLHIREPEDAIVSRGAVIATIE